ncbi:hypothetical protein L227DRAFT_571402 [Lentinus tigrinus ALCF2SS1-6]|uniref:Uncharacterized protein n=1 Tax=Lentinus tigrinus ALCF2SS1-6 TaxID=1328759 RepID=A0A5C2SM79_9APHY|nr:hypothetical protein L227DRAFT_571402 [Lentinus tigrinus ALCF2SS1-6]
MPTPTTQSDALFDFEIENDMNADVAIRILGANGTRAGSMALLAGQTTPPLGLEAGSIYKYAVEKGSRTIELSVRIWRNATCRISAIFDVSPQQCGCTRYIRHSEGVNITAAESAHNNTQIHNTSVSPSHESDGEFC